MVILTGMSGAGKTTVAKRLEKEGFRRAVTYTTRPMREGERDGIDYHFLSPEKFDEMEAAGMFLETAHVGECAYGSLREDYMADDTVIILTPDGVEKAVGAMGKDDLLVVYLDAGIPLLKKRLTSRGDAPDAVMRRLAEDMKRFENIRELCSFIIQQRENTTAEQIATLITWLAKGGVKNAAG